MLIDRPNSLGIGPARDELRWLLGHCRAPKIRTRRQFAEDEVILPEGPFKGRRFKAARQPFAGLWLDAVDSGRWQRIATTGPAQSGKTLVCTLIPLLYHLFEIGETVGFAVPDMNMADDKYRKDIFPVIDRTRFRELLPSRGEGSQGGKVKNMVIFKNGAALKFFSGGGGDKSRAGFTTRVMIITEANAFGVSAEASNEATKIQQLYARTKAFGRSALIYVECTVEIETDVIWTLYKQGSESRIACPCPHCQQYVSPEREHLQGWQESLTDVQAQQQAHFVCPTCGHVLTEADRKQMNEQALLVHRGQNVTVVKEVKRGKKKPPQPLIVGNQPDTSTLGFRWSGFHNLFASAGDLARDEWTGARAVDDDKAEKELCQFIWCLPHKGDTTELVTLHPHTLAARQAKTPRGTIPAATKLVTVQMDVGKWKCWWQAIAWQEGATAVVFDYDAIGVPSNEIGEERGIAYALEQLRQKCELGWTWQGHAEPRAADLIGIDSGYQGRDMAGQATTVVYDFIRARQHDQNTHDRYYPTKGFGHGQLAGHIYSAPKKTGGQIRYVGESYHISYLPTHQVALLEFDSDFWKSHFHERLATPIDPTGALSPGAIVLFADLPKVHQQIARHWTAERQQEQYIPGKGVELCWVSLRRGNHHLDVSVGNCILAHFGGIRVLPKPATPPPPSAAPAPSVHTPHGQAFSILER